MLARIYLPFALGLIIIKYVFDLLYETVCLSIVMKIIAKITV